jgi:hypothetical protein
MKLFKLSTVLLFTAAIVFVSCKGKSAKDQIVKKWQVTDISGKRFADMPEAEKKEKISGASMEFKKDGSFVMIGMGSSNQEGTYSVSDDGKTLYSTDKGSTSTDTLQIVEIGADKLVVSDKEGNAKVSFK